MLQDATIDILGDNVQVTIWYNGKEFSAEYSYREVHEATIENLIEQTEFSAGEANANQGTDSPTE